ncbi:phasin family protein [Indioceanicola profundi]|uniref:phasin family protein n=1 Tax=Indioceanicola profundi TaxID=2220096 RepID=UPI0013C45F20|nr:phasin family protein [Indioceanicola profundi]
MATETTSTKNDSRTATQQAATELARIARTADGAGAAEAAAKVGSDSARSLSASTAGNMEAFLQAQAIMAEGMRTAWQEWMGYSQSAMQRWTEKLQTPLQIRSPQDIMLSQIDTAREEMDQLLQNSMRVSDLMTKAAGSAMRRITERGSAVASDAVQDSAEMQRPAA